jgi:hypothetical protein
MSVLDAQRLVSLGGTRKQYNRAWILWSATLRTDQMSLLTGNFVSEGITQDAQIPPSWWICGLVRGTMVRSFGGVFGILQTSPF